MGMLEPFSSVLKSGKIRYIETAAESGSNRILALMNRDYTIEEYKNIVTTIRKASPKTLIRTQLVAGFPTETEQDFIDTMNLVDEVVFDFVEVYEYHDVLGTAASRIEPKVPDYIKNSRNSQLYKKAMLNRSMRKLKRLILPT
jgi:tRNA A37 methylthiotransferase MiaB